MRFVGSVLLVSFAVLSGVTLSGCVAPPPATPPAPRLPFPRPTLAPPPVAVSPTTTTGDGAVSPGIWTYGTDARGSRAMFGQANRDALLVVRCDRSARRIFVSVPGSAPDTLTLRATSTLSQYAARPSGSSPAYVAVDIAPSDPLLDALAFSRGRFTVALGSRALAVPAWPEFTRVVEDCRA